ncbi:hypothetical protein M2232_009287 [Bradyrhizobium japonicum]|nr:hypothetical protein [Bradyrhizobium japonicum]MCW2340966.1 hypothetical protein [Bradyrhizobium japonicum]
MPDEFVDAFVKAGASLWRLLGTASAFAGSADASSAMDSAARLAELQVDHLRRFCALAEHVSRRVQGSRARPRSSLHAETGDSIARNGVLLRQCYLLNSRY